MVPADPSWLWGYTEVLLAAGEELLPQLAEGGPYVAVATLEGQERRLVASLAEAGRRRGARLTGLSTALEVSLALLADLEARYCRDPESSGLFDQAEEELDEAAVALERERVRSERTARERELSAERDKARGLRR